MIKYNVFFFMILIDLLFQIIPKYNYFYYFIKNSNYIILNK